MIKQRLQQKLLQKLSPQQIQLIKLLEVPTIELDQRIKKEIEENPVLEEGREEEFELKEQSDNDGDNDGNIDVNEAPHENSDEFSLDDYMEYDDTPSYRLSTNNYSKDDKKYDNNYSDFSSFHEFMKQQLSLRLLNEREIQLAEYIIGNIDEEGYLRRDIDDIVDDMAFHQAVETTYEEMIAVLRIIQNFDPPGVGARSLQECLILQLERKLLTSKENTDKIKLAKKILSDYFSEFTKKHYSKIAIRINVLESELKEAVDEILKLNPKPGNSFSEAPEKNLQLIIPDFILDVKEGKILVELNSRNEPELRINKTYSDMLSNISEGKQKITKTEKETMTFVKHKLDSAKWFIEAIKQRKNTLLTTMEAIVEYQHNYFLEGDEMELKPMILKDIAEKTKLDISTISRVANSKYIQTHFGIFPLKYFFSEGMQTDNGEEVSTREIKSILQEFIGNESKKKPLTDAKLSEILQKQGYQIARRTVAKYREQLNIPVARLRKEL